MTNRIIDWLKKSKQNIVAKPVSAKNGNRESNNQKGDIAFKYHNI